MDLVETAYNFSTTILDCNNLVAMHRAHGGGQQGRRTIESSANGAIIVLAIGAWQTAIENLALTMVELAEPDADAPLSLASYRLLAGDLKKAINDFSTPNAQNSRNLLRRAGLDPWPHWTWVQNGGQGIGQVTVSPTQAGEKLDSWLKVRHSVAHGDVVPPEVKVLECYRQPRPSLEPRIRLVDSRQCVSFIKRMALLTANAISYDLQVENGEWPAV